LISEALGILQYIPQSGRNPSYNLEAVIAQCQVQAGQEEIDDLDEMLAGNMISRREWPGFLNQLCKTCDLQRKLPTSMIIPPTGKKYTTPMYGGGSADVFRDEYQGRSVAIKYMRIYTSNDRNVEMSRFCREAVAWRHLRHTNILPLLGVTMEPNKLMFVSEWMENGNISAFVRKHQEVNRVQLLVDVALGLEYLHDLNLVHGDLKGANILIKKDRRACIANFGLSTITSLAFGPSTDSIAAFSEASGLSADSRISLMDHMSGGTAQWTSPELLYPDRYGLKRDHRPTKQSDCYALGMVIYEVLCGRVPYWDKSNPALAILQGVRPTKPPTMATLGFTEDLWWTVECCWMEDRALRPKVKVVLSHLAHAASVWERG